MNSPHLSRLSQHRPRLSSALFSKLLVLALALLIVACASTTVAGNSSPTPAPTFASTSGNDLVTVVEQSPVPGAVTVHITELEFSIISSLTTFQPGVHYYFVVSNRGKQTHALTFVPTYPDGKPMDEYYQYSHMLIGLNTIPPGTTQTINYTFKSSESGHYEMACRMRNHYMAGMHIPVIIM
jgi:uncharacterized cupredoxin-like copper-binding protein